jgi:hypothetical protein
MLVAAAFSCATDVRVGTAASQNPEPAAIATPFTLVHPTRRAPDAPPAAPRELPLSARHVKPMAFDIVIRSHPTTGAPHTARQRIARTAERVHIADTDGTEWFFERNPLDARRVSGSFIDHSTHEIVVYQESELRNRLGLSGWADVLMLGARPELIHGMKRTGQERTIGGLTFVRFAAPDKQTWVTEVWWNEEQLLPAGMITSSNAKTIELRLEGLSAAVRPELLRRPAVRFPKYRVIDFPDWLERH